MTCSKCGAETDGEAGRCSQCGEELQPPAAAAAQAPVTDGILCECGATSSRQHHFCVACGARLSHENVPPAPRPDPLNAKTELPSWLKSAAPGVGPASTPGGGDTGSLKQRVIPLPLKGNDLPAPVAPQAVAPPAAGNAGMVAGPTRMLKLELEARPVPPTEAAPPTSQPPGRRGEDTPAGPSLSITAPVTVPVLEALPPAEAPTAAREESLFSAPPTRQDKDQAVAPPLDEEEEEDVRPPSLGKLKSIRTGKVYDLDKEINTMGRRSPTEGIEPDIDCTVMDDDFFCSRRHARVLVQNSIYYAEDLGSANGTYLNNAALAPHSPTPMKEGDRLRLGNVEFVFTMGLARLATSTEQSDPQAALIIQPGTMENRSPVRMSVDLQAMEKHLRTSGHQTRDIDAGGYRVHIDLSSQVLGIHMPDETQERGKREPVLLATLPLNSPPTFLSSSVLGLKAQVFNMGLHAAVEVAAQGGYGTFPGKANMLKRLAQVLSTQPHGDLGNVPEVLFGSMVLGELDTEPPRGLVNNVINRVTEFRAHEEISHPVDFYTFSKELEAIYKQDRILETPLGGQQAVYEFVRLMAGDKPLRDAYEACLSLLHSMTFPPSPLEKDLGSYLQLWDEGRMEAETGQVSFFPPSRSHPVQLGRRLLGDAPVDLGASFDDVVREMRAGRTMLTPTDRSGWYDYVTWALEPLISPERMPEANQLHQADSYRRQLLDLFKEQLSLTREPHGRTTESHLPPVPSTHQTQANVPVINIEPGVTVEPTASYYLRVAVSYRFVRMVLDALFGQQGLQAMRRLGPRGETAQSIEYELLMMESLFYGAHVVACQELGLATDTTLPIGSGEGPEADAARFLMWMKQLDQDEDLSSDIRTMIPLGYDAEKRKIKVWMTLGWASRPIRFYFFEQPIATVLDGTGRKVQEGAVALHFRDLPQTLWYPITATTYVDKLMPNDKFRSVCNANGIASSIMQAVTGR